VTAGQGGGLASTPARNGPRSRLIRPARQQHAQRSLNSGTGLFIPDTVPVDVPALARDGVIPSSG
jgi:hypothetical protein